MVIAATSLSASAQKSRQVDTLLVTTIPEMHCSGCEERIKEKRSNGVHNTNEACQITKESPQRKETCLYEKESYPASSIR